MINLETILVCPVTKEPLNNISGKYLQSPEGRKYPIFENGSYCLLPEEQLPDNVWDKQIEAFGRRGTSHSWAFNHWHDLGLEKLIGRATNTNVLLNFGSSYKKEDQALIDMGYTTVSLDIDPMDGVDVVADGHCLPFADNSFDTIISFEVLEHVKHPWVVIKELQRVLKPNGRFVGSVAFLKQFHFSYFHMSHYGITELLNFGGLKVVNIYGGQNFMSTLVRLTYPIGPGKFSMKVYDFIFNATVNLRTFAWSIIRKKKINEKLDRFDEKYSFTYKEWLTIKNAGCIIFESINDKEKVG